LIAVQGPKATQVSYLGEEGLNLMVDTKTDKELQSSIINNVAARNQFLQAQEKLELEQQGSKLSFSKSQVSQQEQKRQFYEELHRFSMSDVQERLGEGGQAYLEKEYFQSGECVSNMFSTAASK